MTPDFEILFHALGLDERHDEPPEAHAVATPLPEVA